MGAHNEIGICARGFRIFDCNMNWKTLFQLLCSIMLLTGQSEARTACGGMRCFNGGTPSIGRSLFTICKCDCPVGFVGMTCRYRTSFPAKRNTDSMMLSIRRRLESLSKRVQPRRRNPYEIVIDKR